MTDTPKKPDVPGHRYYRLTHEEWQEKTRRYKYAEVKVLYYLRTLDPFGERWLDIEVTVLAEKLGLHKGTVSRALRELANERDIELEISTARVRLFFHGKVLSTDNQLSTDNFDDLQTTPEICRQLQRSVDNTPILKPSQGGSSRNGDVPINKSNYLKQNKLVPTHPPCSEKDIDREGVGTDPQNPLEADGAKLLAQIQEAGAIPNKTIQRAIASLLTQQGSARATEIVENSISALQEQQEKGTVRNPGGFIVTALKRHFTANQAKKQARERRQGKSQPISLNQEEMQIDSYLISDRRDWALTKLQHLWASGWHDQVEELLQIRQDWGFVVTEQGGVMDAKR